MTLDTDFMIAVMLMIFITSHSQVHWIGKVGVILLLATSTMLDILNSIDEAFILLGEALTQ